MNVVTKVGLAVLGAAALVGGGVAAHLLDADGEPATADPTSTPRGRGAPADGTHVAPTTEPAMTSSTTVERAHVPSPSADLDATAPTTSPATTTAPPSSTPAAPATTAAPSAPVAPAVEVASIAQRLIAAHDISRDGRIAVAPQEYLGDPATWDAQVAVGSLPDTELVASTATNDLDLTQNLMSITVTPGPAPAATWLERADGDGDGHVTNDELTSHIARTWGDGTPRIQQPGYERFLTETATPA